MDGPQPVYEIKNIDWLMELMRIETDDCVLWDRGLDAGGYAQVNSQGTGHRLVCRIAYGEPSFLRAHAAHSCGVRRCVNPRHLRWATAAENMADKKSQKDTVKPHTCPKPTGVRHGDTWACPECGIHWRISFVYRGQTPCIRRWRMT